MKPVSAKELLELDKHMESTVLQCYSIPEQVVYQAAKNDYSEDPIQKAKIPPPSECGKWIVERLLSNEKGHYGCYSTDTEVLTNKGWVFWDEVDFNTHLAAYNLSTKEIHFEKPSAIQRWEYKDKMYSLSGEEIDVLVSPDHRMVYQEFLPDKECGKLPVTFISRADQLYGKEDVRYYTNGYLSAEERKEFDSHKHAGLRSFWSLIGFWLATEHTHLGMHEIHFVIYEPQQIEYIKSLCDDLDFAFIPLGADRFLVSYSFIGKWFRENLLVQGTDYKKLPDNYIRLKRTLALSVFEGIRILAPNGPFTLPNQDSLLDELQILFCLNGHKAIIINSNNNRQLHFTDTLFSEVTKGYEENWVNYDGYIHCATVSTGVLVVRRNGKVIVCGNCLEHPQITLSCSGFVHNVMVQARTHRVGVTFDCQSQRYTGKRILKVVSGELNIDDVFYIRPPGLYTNRQGKKYEWTEEDYEDELRFILKGCQRYADKYNKGMCEEHIRDYLPQAIRQNFVVSFNLRSGLHFMDLRAKMDAQLEIRALCESIWPHFKTWAPNVATYYEEKRLYKARLSP